MGQKIEILDTTVEGPLAAFHTDRGITGQDGQAFDPASASAETESIPESLAARLFAADADIDHAFVVSNQVVLRRPVGWEDSTVAAAGDIIERFFVFYAE